MMFAQQFREMLTQTTFESFRVYSLDTIARLSEALELIDEVVLGHIPRAALEPALDELIWSLEEDPVASRRIATTIQSFKQSASAEGLANVRAHIVLMIKKLSHDYKEKLEGQILELADAEKRRKLLRISTAFYCSHLVNLGYSKTFLLACTNEAFFSKDMTRVNLSALRQFFRRFSGKEKHFTVLTDLDDSFAHYLKTLRFKVLTKRALPRSVVEALNSDYTKVLQSKVVALDPYGAMLSVRGTLSSLRAMTYLSPFGIPCEWDDKMHVQNARANVGSTWTFVEVALDRPSGRPRPSGRRFRNTRINAQRILSNFNNESTKRLLSSINTAALARSSGDMENQLISMWAAVEVILSEPEGKVRITHFLDLMTPCICINHIRKQLIAFNQELVVSYRKRFTDLLMEAMPGTDHTPQIALASIILLPNPILQRQLSSLLKDNPLALQRLWHAQESYRDPRSIRSSVENHEKRVRWQLSRIYRVRNSLVHAGKAPAYLDSLLINATEYYRSAVSSIVQRAHSENHESDLDQTIAEIGIDYRLFKKSFEARDAALSYEDIKRLVGRWSP